MEIIIKNTPDEVAEYAADIFSTYIRAGATLGLATGSTPLGLYAKLIDRYKNDGLSFKNCRAFLLDEYVGLPKHHRQSYYATIRREFSSQIDIDDAAVLSPAGEASDTVGQEYEAAIAAAGGIDVQLLGIGTNGHVGFNEPGSSLSSRTRVKVLHPQTIKDNSRFFESESQVPVTAVTQGLGTISEAKHVLLLATGETKAPAIAALVEGAVSAQCPASVLQLHPHVTVIIDTAAADKLKHKEYYRFVCEHAPTWH